jgi:hypothetical protein
MPNQTIDLKVVGASNFGQYPKISNEKTYNMYISDDVLVPFAGYNAISRITPNGVGRALFNSPRFGNLVAVVGNRVAVIDSNGAVSLIGEIKTETGNVFITENNGTQIAITDIEGYYVFNWETEVFTSVELPFQFNYIDFQDTYVIGAVANTNTWQLSALNNALSFPNDETTQGALETRGDIVQAVVRLGRQLMVMGATVTDTQYDYGSSPFPYQRNNWYSIEYGVVNPATIAISDNFMVWLGANEKQGIAILMSQGQSAEQISTDGVNFTMSQLKQPTNAFAMLFKQAGHIFYQITWPADNLTLVYDFNTKNFYHLSDQNGNYHIARSVAFFNNDYYFVSANDSNLYKMDSTFYTYNGNEIPRVRQIPNFALPNNAPFLINDLTIYMEQGNSNFPQKIQTSISKDGSMFYGKKNDTILNPIGHRQNRYRLLNLGRANEFSLRYTLWGLDKFIIKSGTITLTTG